MRRVLILGLFLVMTQNIGNCATTNMFPMLQPISGNPMQAYNNDITNLPDQFAKPLNQNYSDISKIEQKLFGRIFVNQNITTRLSRIEKSLFTTTYPNSTNSQRIDNIISNFNQINKFPNISGNELSRLESKVFNQKFPQFDSQQRIERLEQQMFGAVQSGDYSSRYEALKMAAKAYNKRIQDSQNQFPQGGLMGIAGSLLGGNSAGYMTGFTPPINPYNNYNAYQNPYTSSSQPRSGIYRGSGVDRGLGGYSYNESFSDYGSGMGVTILD